MMNLATHSDDKRTVLRRIGRTLAASLAVVASLLTFPSGTPWMVAFWLAWHSLSALRGRSGHWPLAACAAIVLVKRLPLSPGLAALAGTAVACELLTACTSGRLPTGETAATSTARRWVVRAAPVVCLWAAWYYMAWDWDAAARCDMPRPLRHGRPVVCLGDSLTWGGMKETGYPQTLKSIIGLPVVNLGRPGVTSNQALKRLPELAAARPQAVVIELGGHDFLRGRSRAETKANFEKIIAAAMRVEANVVLMEVPHGFIIDPYAGLERELARQYNLELVPDTAIRMLVVRSPYFPLDQWIDLPHLSQDGLHPNDRGDEFLARQVARSLKRMYGEGVLRGGEN